MTTQLQQIRNAISKLKQTLQHETEKNKGLNEIRALVKRHGLTQIDLRGIALKSPKTRTLRPKYRNPDDPSQTWAGRGTAPRWIRNKKRDAFLITEGQGRTLRINPTKSKATKKGPRPPRPSEIRARLEREKAKAAA